MKIRGAEPEPESEFNGIQCWGENSHSQMLRLEMRDGRFYLYPYGWLERVEFSPAENADTLTLILGDQAIRIVGKKLRGLGLALQRMTVDWVKEFPDRFDSIGSAGGTFVRSIEVATENSNISPNRRV